MASGDRALSAQRRWCADHGISDDLRRGSAPWQRHDRKHRGEVSHIASERTET